MSFRSLISAALLLAAFGFASEGRAQGAVIDSTGAQVIVETSAHKILEQQTEIREEAGAKQGRYRDMDRRELTRLEKEQDLVFALLEGKASSTELAREDQLKLFNSLETIAAIVNRAEDDRMVCRRTRRTGSNMSETVCKTVAQRREEEERARSAFATRPAVSCGEDCP
jgi:hypothetical protein